MPTSRTFTAQQLLAAVAFAEADLRDRLGHQVLQRAGDQIHPVIVTRYADRLCLADVRLARVQFHPPVGTFDPAAQRRLRRAFTAWVNRLNRTPAGVPAHRRLRLDAVGVYLDTRGNPRVLEHVPGAY